MSDIEDLRYKNSAIEIPEDIKPVLKGLIPTKKSLLIELGIKYSNNKIRETKLDDFTKFKNNIKKALSERYVEKKDINKIVGVIQDNDDKIYPDIEDDQGSSDFNQKEDSNSERPKIEYDKWQSVLFEKYMDLKKVCDKNFPGIWHSIEFESLILTNVSAKLNLI